MLNCSRVTRDGLSSWILLVVVYVFFMLNFSRRPLVSAHRAEF